MKKQIRNYSNYYIYDNGDVLNIDTNKVLKGSISEHGYKYYRLSKDNKKTMFYAHRLVAEYFLDNPNQYPVVNHIDGNKLNNNKENLEWVTYSKNITHAHQNNLIKTRRKSEFFTQNLQGEEWKKIKNLPYSISSKGRVRNDRTNLLLKGSLACGYLKVRLSYQGKIIDKLVHHLVYLNFNGLNEIPQGKVIDHIDGNKNNNNLENLQLVSLSENVKNAFYKTKTNSSIREVIQMDLQGNQLNIFPSCSEAGRVLNLDRSSISKVCRGVVKTCGGFRFKYR